MDVLMKNIDFLNKNLFEAVKNNYPIGLAYGKMGLIIYLYSLYQYTQDVGYKEYAERLLDILLEKELFRDTILTFEDGLCGISFGLEYLIQKSYIDGDINKLSKEIDGLLYYQVSFDNIDKCYDLSELSYLLCYINHRIDSIHDIEELFIMKKLSMKVINKVDTLLDSSFFLEPCSFSLFSYCLPVLLHSVIGLLKKDICNIRIMKVLEHISFYLFSHQPNIHLNRLYLFCSILPARNISLEWNSYVENMKKNIDIDRILHFEIKNRNIYISNGFPFLYILLEYLKMYFPEYAFKYNPQDIYHRIIFSEAWEELKNKSYYFQIHKGLLNGFPGSILTLFDIKKKYL